ncbi:MYCBP-associated protein [Sphaeramia orbicularis]|uniref:MYCBP-associated protein n=1 Tax=Sphaeramia orbicularis TaxID=375764 RepID=UPI0011808FE7|nr:MYCBP-associated protein [Sphaeramia orbicularis]
MRNGKSQVDLSLHNNQPTLNTSTGLNIQALDTCSEGLRKIPISNQPKDVQKPVKPADKVCTDTSCQPLDYTGPDWFQFDDKGMILPHSILGSLEEFRNYLEAKGETELLKRIPKEQSDHFFKTSGKRGNVEDELKIPSGQRNTQANALEHWQVHMRQRRQQQDFLSGLLHRPVENLLMNQANSFRQTQEQREATPLIHSGYGYRVCSEFWSLPQRYGDEMSGITATLTKTEQGIREPVTWIGQPRSIHQESGLIHSDTVRPASRTWDKKAYPKHQCQEYGEVVQNMDIKKPDIERLEVIGCGKPHCSPIVNKEKEDKQQKEKEKLDLQTDDDVQPEVMHIPALRFCGKLATWTGNSTTHQGEVGISARMFFESLTGQISVSNMELHNEGSTAIFYNWQQIPLPQYLPHLLSKKRKRTYFYFNPSPGVISPGETQKVEIIFKSEEPGVKTELWQLNTHPLLLQGASIQVTMRGVALYEDKYEEERLLFERRLEKIVTEKICRSIVEEIVQGIHTPERPSSPAELYKTEEQEFLCKNPKMQYSEQPVDGLKSLWQAANPGASWDLCVNTLRQVLLDLPDDESTHTSLNREKGLAQLNSLILQLSEPLPKYHPPTVVTLWKQLWRKQLDTMETEAVHLRRLLGLSEKDTWMDKKDESIISDSDMADSTSKTDKSDKKRGTPVKEGRSMARSRVKDDSKGESKSTEEIRKKGHSEEKRGKDTGSVTDVHHQSMIQQCSDDQSVDSKMKDIYPRLLRQKVYALIEELMDNLCDLYDEP